MKFTARGTTDTAIEASAQEVVQVPLPEPTMAEASTAISLISADDEWEGVSDGDLTPTAGPTAIPMLTLNRKLDGGFTLPDTNEVVPELDLVLLAKQNTRAWFSKPYGTKDAAGVPDCWSADAVTPDPRSVQVMSESCATCPLAQWDVTDQPVTEPGAAIPR